MEGKSTDQNSSKPIECINPINKWKENLQNAKQREECFLQGIERTTSTATRGLEDPRVEAYATHRPSTSESVCMLAVASCNGIFSFAASTICHHPSCTIDLCPKLHRRWFS
jgi:hypothetical protein